MAADDEEERLRSTTLQNAQSILLARRRAEEEMRKQAELIRVTLSSIGDAVISTDFDTRITFMNGIAESLTGWTSADAIGHALEEIFHIVHEQSRQPVENPANRALHEGTVVGLGDHTILIAKDGSEKPIDDSAAPIRDADGKVAGVVLVFRDITERKQQEIIGAEQNRLTAMRADVNSALALGRDTHAVLNSCCEALVEHLGVAFARVWTLNENEKVLELMASAGQYTHLDGAHCRIKVGEFKIGRIASSRQPHLTNDTYHDPNVSDHDWAKREGMLAFAGYPLEVDSRVVGVVAMFSRRPFTENTLKDLAPFAFGIAQFIDRKRTERLIQEQYDLLRVTLESIGDAVISTDTQGNVSNMNPVAESLTGWTMSNALGQPLDLIFNIINETTRVRVDNPATRALAQGVIVGLANHTILIAKNGAERAIDDSAAPIRAKNGEIIGCVLVFRDVTTARKAENALRESEEFSRSILEGSPDCINVLGPDGRVLRMNSHGQFLAEIDDFSSVAGRYWPDLWPEPGKKDALAALAAARGHSIGRFEGLCPTSKGTLKWWDVMVAPVHNADGELVRVICVSRDISEQRQAAEELRQLAAELSDVDRRKNEFLAMLAHELRNPLAPIKNAVHLVRLSNGNDDQASMATEIIERQVQHLVRLVDDLLDVSRISHGKIELRLERVEIGSIVQQAIETSRPAILAARHNLTVNLPPKPVYVRGDPVRLAQVISNLLNNSCKYSEVEGRIRVNVEQQGNKITVSVHDKGIGIAAEMLPRVFDLFTQIDRSLDRSQGGLGVGLTLVQRIVKMHDGCVNVSSEGIGKGSEFIVQLPAFFESEIPLIQQDEVKASKISAQRILVVDDNLDSARTLSMLLKFDGHDSRTAFDGVAAFDAAESFRPDFIVLDIGLPKRNGYEVARAIRAQAWGKKIILIALTGWGQDEDKQKSKEAGFDYHLVKPVIFKELMKLLALRDSGMNM